MLKKELERVVNGVAAEVLYGEFLIELDVFVDYLFFHIVADEIQKSVEGDAVSLRKYMQADLSAVQEELENESKDVDETYRAVRNIYEQKLYQFNNMNIENQLKYQNRIKNQSQLREEKSNEGENLQGKAARYKDHTEIQPFQSHELDILLKIGDKNNDSKEIKRIRSTLKKLTSPKGKLQNIKFHDMEHAINFLRMAFLQDDRVQYKNIQEYKLEKRMHFETIKVIAKIIEDDYRLGASILLKEFSESQLREMQKDLIRQLALIMNIPLLGVREEYMNAYLNSLDDPHADQKWKAEIQSIINFIQIAYRIWMNQLDKNPDLRKQIITDENLSYFKTLYTFDSFDSQYDIEKDFSNETFKLVMRVIGDEHSAGRKKLLNN